MPGKFIAGRLGAIRTRLRALNAVRVLRHSDFMRYVTSAWVAMVGSWIQRIGIGWLTWDMTHSGAWLGAVALGGSLPAVFLVPFAGAIGDRMDRVRMLRLSNGAQIGVSAALAGFTLAGLIDVWLVLALTLAIGTLEAMATPARLTIAPGLVPREDLSGAIALNSVAYNLATFVGPAVAGLVITGAGIGYTFALTAFTYIPNQIVLLRLKLRAAEHVPGAGWSILADIVEAVRYLARHRGIGPVLVLAIIGAVTVRHLPELMPGFADAVFGRGPEALGALVAVFGVGGMLGSLWLANRNRLPGTTAIFYFGMMFNAVFVFAFASSANFAVGLIAASLFGFSMASAGNSAQILVQSAVAGAMRARVMSLYSLTFRGGPAVGAMLFGALSTAFGLQAPVAAGALVCFAAGLVMLRRRRAVAAILEEPPKYLG